MALIEIGVIIIVAKIAGDLASRFGQPPVLGQLLVGLMLGLLSQPFDGPALQSANAEVTQLANLGVILLKNHYYPTLFVDSVPDP